MKHNQILKRIKKRLNNNSLESIICSEEEFVLNNCICGEADIYSIRNDLGIAVEVKTRDHERARNKASYQLEKDMMYLRQEYKIEKYVGFYAYTDINKRRGYNVEKVIEHEF